jgi:diguanylate cyclase
MKKFKFVRSNKFYIIVFVTLLVLFYMSASYVKFLAQTKDRLEKENFSLVALGMQKNLEQMIVVKQKSTVAMALSLANDAVFIQNVKEKNFEEFNFKKLLNNYREYTLYKNIWIQVVDKEGNTLYKSWSDEKNENLLNFRPDIKKALIDQKIVTSISTGRHNLSLRAIVPLFCSVGFVGAIEIISHFNSISLTLKESAIDSVVLVDKHYKEQLKYPATGLFVGEYYVANYDAPLYLRNLLEGDVAKYYKDGFIIENGKLIVSYLLRDIDNKPIGSYVMARPLADVSSAGLELYIFKWIAFSVFVVMGVMIFFSSLLYYSKSKSKKYYENIINNSSNIIFINDESGTIKVNNTFLRYFKEFQSFEEFKYSHRCVAEFFKNEDGYIGTNTHGVFWIDYLLENKKKKNSVKIEIAGDVKYFSISASLISSDPNHYAIIMSDITEQENYKQELEHRTITDSLTGIKNRRYFHENMKIECSKAFRYGSPFCVIMFDIDFFKKVNDEHGHIVGDEVLKEYTRFIATSLRDSDIFCRIGGEEFIILLPHVELKNALLKAERIRKSVEEHKKVLPITMSFGVAQYSMGEDEDTLFKRVDEALYKAKESGRNKVVEA